MKTDEINPADVLAQKEAGESLRSIAKQFGISTSTVSRLVAKALDAKVDAATGATPDVTTDDLDTAHPFITGATQSEIKASYERAVVRAKAEHGGKVPVHVTKAIKAATQAATDAIDPNRKAPKRTGSRSGARRVEVHPRHRQALDTKKSCGHVVTPKMAASRKRVTQEELVALIRKALKANPDTYQKAELEYAYWVANLSVSAGTFAKAWAQATAA